MADSQGHAPPGGDVRATTPRGRLFSTTPHTLRAVRGQRFGVRDVRIRGFRSARLASFAPGPVCALVGGPSVGKSNVLLAIWTLLQRGSPTPARGDFAAGSTEGIRLSARLADGEEITLVTSAPGQAAARGGPIPVLFLPASRRSGRLVMEPTEAPLATRLASDYFGGGSDASPGMSAALLMRAVESLCEAGEHELVLIIEEPELFLRPQAQRYLYRLLRSFAANGNQVLYSTHAPAFLNAGRLEELALVEFGPQSGTTVIQPEPLAADESFRALSELDAERSELFLARAVLLVEGRTEKLTFPFVFRALDHDVDREAITIVDCGGKPNIPLLIRVCQTARIPCAVVHDRDAEPGRRPSRGERALNAEIAALAGPQRTIALAPDFEAVAGLHGHRHKPARAWQLFSSIERDRVPAPLVRAVETVVALARG
jgi:putative ATP-dependent endonuclease of the OLD family